MPTELHKKQISTFLDLIPAPWKTRDEYQRAIMCFFPSAIYQWEGSLENALQLKKIVEAISSHPVGFNPITLAHDNELPFPRAFIGYKEGTPFLGSKLEKAVFPAGDYLAIFSPIPIQNEGEAREAIAVCRGILTAGLGHAIAEKAIGETHIHLHDDKTSYASEVVERFLPPKDHVFFQTSSARELGDRILRHIPEELRRRLRTAFLFIGTAAGVTDPTVRFANLWIALEVACGSSGKATAALAAIAGPSLDQACRTIRNARHDLFHKGQEYILSRDEERLMKAAIFHSVAEFYNVAEFIAPPTFDVTTFEAGHPRSST